MTNYQVTVTDTRNGTNETQAYGSKHEAYEAAQREYDARRPKRFARTTAWDKASNTNATMTLNWRDDRGWELTVTAQPAQ